MALRGFLGVEARGLAAEGLLRELEAVPADLKVVAAANLHVTLAFLGGMAESAVPAALAAAREAARGESAFRMEAEGLGTFPPRGAPRVLWAGLRGAEPLARIAGRLRPLLAAAGLRTEDRDFHAHLTLARARSGRGAEAVRRFVQARSTLRLGAVDVRRIVLFESRLGPKGPAYHALGAAELEAAA